jgi:tRNA threonylcarbamoyladenosine biosynthesis protein TsaE
MPCREFLTEHALTQAGETLQFITRPVDEIELEAIARAMAEQLMPPMIIYLQGDLGAGKTTFTRALLRGLGYAGAVKSPTYGLLEVYSLQDVDLVHLDLYRIAETGELDFLGLEDLHSQRSVFMIEWPDRGAGRLPEPDLAIEFAYVGDLRSLTFSAYQPFAIKLCELFSKKLKGYSS